MRKGIIVAIAMSFALSSMAAAQVTEIVIDFPSAGIVGLPEVPNFVEVPADNAEALGAVVEVMPGDNIRIRLPSTGETEIPCKC
jgi:hypothetical protein